VAELRLIICSNPRRLLEAAGDGFLTPPKATLEVPFPSLQYLLALRQGGLRDDLIALAAERKVTGWFDPPLCVFHELPDWLGKTDRRPLGDQERVVLLSRVVSRVAGDVFNRLARVRDFVHAVDRLVGELASEGVSPDEFGAALSNVPYADEFERRRDAELAAVYRAYQETLAEAGARDGRDAYVDTARAVLADPDGLAERLAGRREIRIFGLHDLRGGWKTLLQALRDSAALDRVAVYAADEVIVGEGLDAEVERLGCEPNIGDRVFQSDEPGDESIDLIVAPDIEREVEEVARRVRSLAEQGTPLTSIAVVSRKARPHVDLAVQALERLGVPATARRRIGFSEIPVVRALSALSAAAADGWTRHGLVELASQPYIANGLDARILNNIGYRRRVSGLRSWHRQLEDLEAEAMAHEQGDEEHDDHRKPPPQSSRVRSTREALERFMVHAETLDSSRSLSEWLGWLSGLLERDPWGIERAIYDVPDRRFRIARVDLAGWRALKGAVAEWQEAVLRWGDDGDAVSAAVFFDELRDVLSGDAALWTATYRGVQVLEGLAAVYRPFDRVFIVGMEAGRFPARSAQSPIIDESDRQVLREAGLPLELRETWDARERSLFRILLAGARERITLSYSRLDDAGREVVGSSFLEAVADVASVADFEVPADRVVAPDVSLFRSATVIEQVTHAAGMERLRETGALNPYNGLIEEPALVAWLAERYGDEYVWSPTQLESYAKCPWAFFSARALRLESLEDPDQDMDAATRGTIWHDALRRFFEAAGRRVGGPVFLREGDLAWAEPLLLESLDDALEDARKRRWVGHEALYTAKREELRRVLLKYLRWEVQEHEDMYSTRKRKAPTVLRTGVVGHELAFADQVLDRDGVRFTFRGVIDRVEQGIDERFAASDFVAAVDYKSSRWSAPGGGDKSAWDDDVVLQVPLYAHALSQLRPGSRVSRTEYRALRSCESVLDLHLYSVDKKSGELIENVDAQEKMHAALGAVVRHVNSVRSGRFAADPAPSCSCPPFCHAGDICRVLGGPGSHSRWS